MYIHVHVVYTVFFFAADAEASQLNTNRSDEQLRDAAPPSSNVAPASPQCAQGNLKIPLQHAWVEI